MFDSAGNQRGTITNNARIRQVCNFSGLQFGKITPTDVDAALEFDNRLFFFIEAKYEATPIKRGQMLFLERLADGLTSSPSKFGVSIIADHSATTDQDINFLNLSVRAVRWEKSWFEPDYEITAAQVIKDIIAHVELLQGRQLYARA